MSTRTDFDDDLNEGIPTPTELSDFFYVIAADYADDRPDLAVISAVLGAALAEQDYEITLKIAKFCRSVAGEELLKRGIDLNHDEWFGDD